MFGENLCKIQGQFKVRKSQAESWSPNWEIANKSILPSQNLFPQNLRFSFWAGVSQRRTRNCCKHYVVLFPERHSSFTGTAEVFLVGLWVQMFCSFLSTFICPVLRILSGDSFVSSVRKIIFWHTWSQIFVCVFVILVCHLNHTS